MTYYMVKNGNALFGRGNIGFSNKALEQEVRLSGWKLKAKALEQMNQMKSYHNNLEVVKIDTDETLVGVWFDGKRMKKHFRTHILNVATVA